MIRRLLVNLNFYARHANEKLEVAVLSGYLAQITAVQRQIAGSATSGPT